MKKILILCGAAFALAACNSGVKESLGLERTAPDEFAVIERAPLTMPPNFNLVPPTPGSARPQEDVIAGAKGLVLGSTSSASTVQSGSTAEQALLNRAGATSADPSIRAKLADPNDKASKQTSAEKLGITKNKDGALNPVDEAKRLKAENIKTVPVVPSAPKNAK